MSVSVRITSSFKTAVKPLLKKYPSLKTDLLNLERELTDNPKLGTPLGHNAYKIRLKISSKGKGKSGGQESFHWQKQCSLEKFKYMKKISL